MKVAVIGAGAVGGLLACKLWHAGEDVTVVDLGEHLAAIKSDGLVVVENEKRLIARVKTANAIAELDEQDLIVLATKAHQLEEVAAALPRIIGASTTIMTAQNGIPWWYFFKHPGPFEGRRLQSLDPDGMIERHVAVDRVVGSIVYFAAEVVGPGVIRGVEGNRISIGELDGVKTARADGICAALVRSGFKTFVLDDIRSELWLKLWGNSSLNPISALCRASMKDICQYPLTRQLAIDVMTEIQSVGNALGVKFRVPLEKRLAGAEAVGHHKTSMLQDIENGRSTEAEALLGSLIEIGRMVGCATPRLETLYAMIKLLDLMPAKNRASCRSRSSRTITITPSVEAFGGRKVTMDDAPPPAAPSLVAKY